MNLRALPPLGIYTQLVCSLLQNANDSGPVLNPLRQNTAHLWVALTLDLGRAQQELLAHLQCKA